MKKAHLLLLSGLSGILFTVGWPMNGFPAFLFCAFIPLLIIEQHIAENRSEYSKFSVFFYTYPAFFVWNFLTTYWIWNSTPVATLAWLFNAMFMSIVMNVYHVARKNIYGPKQGYFLLPFLWITFEFIHLNWKLTWPWLTLGNGFSMYTQWVQWYDITGALGGTFWIFVINILLFRLYMRFVRHKIPWKELIPGATVVLIILLVPILVSYIQYFGYKESQNPVDVVITQPNVDPYSEQYVLPPKEVIRRNMSLAEQLMDTSTMFVVAPESALQESIWEDNPQWSSSLNLLLEYVGERPHLHIVIGASTYRRLGENEKVTRSARYHEKGKFYYDRYNTAFLVDTSALLQRHHKSKLTPGVEYMPSWGPLSFLENLAIDLGGTVGSLAVDKEQIPFNIGDTLDVAPLICYESIYGEFSGNFIKQGARLIFIITNDGWWGNTPGHKQHFAMARLRAIELRRSIARSANTGISCFIDQRGDVFQETAYWEPAVIRQSLNLNDRITFYARMGDYFGRISAFLSVVFILMSIVFGIRKRKTIEP